MTQLWGRESISLDRLRQILALHRGEQSAVTSETLTRVLGLREKDGRSIREAVNELIEAGDPIGSSVHAPFGYFWILTAEELEACVAQYRSRARENNRKADRLIAAFRVGRRQGELAW